MTFVLDHDVPEAIARVIAQAEVGESSSSLPGLIFGQHAASKRQLI